MSDQPPAEQTISESMMRKVALASGIGTMLDNYDFFVSSGAAALVWPTVYFQGAGPVVAVALSLAALASAYFVRPLGAIFFGHLGDKAFGRYRVVVWTLLTCGIGTFGIALTPGYATIGIVAPLLILIFRMMVGLGLGGEFGGGVSWTAESAARSKHRGFWTGWVLAVMPIGVILGTTAVGSAATLMPQSDFLSWGWRVPFLLGGLGLVIGMVVRFKLYESPWFKEMISKKRVERVPMLALFKENWKLLLLMIGALLIAQAGTLLGTVYLYLLGGAYGISVGTATTILYVGGIFGVPAALGGNFLVERLGRRKTLLLGAWLSFLTGWIEFPAIVMRNVPLVFVGLTLWQVTNRIPFGAMAAMMAEQFPGRYRATAAGFSYAVSNALSGVTLIVLTAVIGMVGVANSWYYVEVEVMLFFGIALICSYKLKETKGKTLEI